MLRAMAMSGAIAPLLHTGTCTYLRACARYMSADDCFCWAAEHHESAGDDGVEEILQGEVGASGGELRANGGHVSSLRSGDAAARGRKNAEKGELVEILFLFCPRGLSTSHFQMS